MMLCADIVSHSEKFNSGLFLKLEVSPGSSFVHSVFQACVIARMLGLVWVQIEDYQKRPVFCYPNASVRRVIEGRTSFWIATPQVLKFSHEVAPVTDDNK